MGIGGTFGQGLFVEVVISKNDLPALDRSLRASVGYAMRRLAEDIASAARELAPYDPKHRDPDPHIRDSIAVEKDPAAPYSYLVTVRNRYAAYVHYGSIHNPRPNPFLQRAYDREVGPGINKIAGIIRTGLGK